MQLFPSRFVGRKAGCRGRSAQAAAGGGGGRSPEPPRWGRQQPREGAVSRSHRQRGGGHEGERWGALLHRGPLQQHGEAPHTPGRTHLSSAQALGLDGGSWSHCPCLHSPADVHTRHGSSRPATAPGACSVCQHGDVAAQRPAGLLPEHPSQPCLPQVCAHGLPSHRRRGPLHPAAPRQSPVIPGGLAVLSLMPVLRPTPRPPEAVN